MRLPDGLVGTAIGPIVQDIDARWLMAYAAALGDVHAEYIDTTRPAGVIGHPLFPVCYEWPLAVELRASVLSEVIAVRSVHATHDLRLHRRARAGDRLSTSATVISSEPRAPGAYVVTRLETVDAHGLPVSTTDYGSIYRGVACERAALPPRPVGRAPDAGAPIEPDRPPDGSPPSREWSVAVSVPPGLAHTYTECARIWNPIHTDKAVARAAGLPDIILHGTATLALAVSAALERTAGPATRIARIGCRFTGMVPLPSAITVQGGAAGEGRIAFRVLGADSRPVLRDGWLVTAGPHDLRAPGA